MASQDYSPAPPQTLAPNGTGARYEPAVARTHERYWLYLLLFCTTFFTTTVVGAGMHYDFVRDIPLSLEDQIEAAARVFSHPSLLLTGLPFSLTLLAILLAHEFGHYFACLYYRIDASLPYFLPAPTLTGTFGAFIRIRSAVFSKRQLFDIGIAGPLAGFVFLLPAIGVGLAFSKIIPGIEHQGAVHFSTPPLIWILERAIFPGVNPADIYLHPVARAAWIGMLATALNLLPIGQLDGGHILYAISTRRHKTISQIAIAILAVIGPFSWWTWTLWAVVLFLLGRRHPMIYDETDIGSGRRRLGYLAFVVFALCFSIAPIKAGAL